MGDVEETETVAVSLEDPLRKIIPYREIVKDRLRRAWNMVELFCAMLIGNRTHYVAATVPSEETAIDKARVWIKKYLARLLKAIGVFAGIVILLVFMCALFVYHIQHPFSVLMPARNVHVFVPVSSSPKIYALVGQVDSHFSCACRVLSDVELIDEIIEIGAEDERTIQVPLANVITMQEHLLEPNGFYESTIMTPKIWNSTDANDAKLMAEGRFNPCVLSVVLESGVTKHMINPVVVEHVTSGKDHDILALDKLLSFGFLERGIEIERFSAIEVRFRSYPHPGKNVVVETFSGVDALRIQSGVQLMKDGYRSALEKTRAELAKLKVRMKDKEIDENKVKFDITDNGSVYYLAE